MCRLTPTSVRVLGVLTVACVVLTAATANPVEDGARLPPRKLSMLNVQNMLQLSEGDKEGAKQTQVIAHLVTKISSLVKERSNLVVKLHRQENESMKAATNGDSDEENGDSEEKLDLDLNSGPKELEGVAEAELEELGDGSPQGNHFRNSAPSNSARQGRAMDRPRSAFKRRRMRNANPPDNSIARQKSKKVLSAIGNVVGGVASAAAPVLGAAAPMLGAAAMGAAGGGMMGMAGGMMQGAMMGGMMQGGMMQGGMMQGGMRGGGCGGSRCGGCGGGCGGGMLSQLRQQEDGFLSDEERMRQESFAPGGGGSNSNDWKIAQLRSRQNSLENEVISLKMKLGQSDSAAGIKNQMLQSEIEEKKE